MYRFQFSPYSRPFKQPLKTNHGTWEKREGIILRLTDKQGNVGSGEIAPLSWFGSESLEQALEFCQQLPETITSELITTIPDEFPACQFGFESALEAIHLSENITIQSSLKFCGLLPSGNAVLDVFKVLCNQGLRTFKWKIAVESIAEELLIFQQLTQQIIETVNSENNPLETIYLRLDANGGLSWSEANQWLLACENIESDCLKIEFIEQPLAVDQFDKMLALNQYYTTAIALDESVATLDNIQDCYQRFWRGIFVIKPAIIGSPRKLRRFCLENQIDAVFSSVFETSVGRQAALRLVTELSPQLSEPKRALGFGVEHWFQEEEID